MRDSTKQLLGLFQDLSGAVAKLKTVCPPDGRDHLDAIFNYTADCLNWAKRTEPYFAPTPDDDVSAKRGYVVSEPVFIGVDLTARESEAVRLVGNAIALACQVVVTMLARPAGDPEIEAPPPPPTPLGGPAFVTGKDSYLMMEESGAGLTFMPPPTDFDIAARPSIRRTAMQRFAFAGRPGGGGTTEGPGPVEAYIRPGGDPTTEGPGPSLMTTMRAMNKSLSLMFRDPSFLATYLELRR